MDSNSERSNSGNTRSGETATRLVPTSIRSVVDSIRENPLAPARLGLPSGEVLLRGEVIEVRSDGKLHYLTLLDGKRNNVAMCARVPAAKPPRVGAMLGIEGHFVSFTKGTKLEVRFEGSKITMRRDQSKRRERLAEALTNARRSHPSPRQIEGQVRRIQVVTSPESKAFADFEFGLGWKRQSVEVKLCPVQLNRPRTIAEGVRASAQNGVDLIVVVRGGGAAVELMPFNDTEVMKAIAEVAARVPVLVAIGHRADHTLADSVASYSLPTPSAAGAFVAKKLWNVPMAATASVPSVPAEQPTSAPVAPWKQRLMRLGQRLLRLLKLILVGAALIGTGWILRGMSSEARIPIEQSQQQPPPGGPAREAGRHR